MLAYTWTLFHIQDYALGMLIVSSNYCYIISMEKYSSNSWSIVGFLTLDWTSAFTTMAKLYSYPVKNSMEIRTEHNTDGILPAWKDKQLSKWNHKYDDICYSPSLVHKLSIKNINYLDLQSIFQMKARTYLGSTHWSREYLQVPYLYIAPCLHTRS